MKNFVRLIYKDIRDYIKMLLRLIQVHRDDIKYLLGLN